VDVDWADIEQGDVDGDGDNDTVGAGATLELFLTTGGLHVPFAGAFPGTSRATSAELADFDNDGFLDVAASFLAPRYLRVWTNQGLDAAGNWLGFAEIPSANIVLTGAASPADVEAADLDGDGFRDIFLACTISPTAGQRNRMFFNQLPAGNVGFQDVTLTNLPDISDDSEDCEILDFDLDGDLDVVIANVDGDNSLFGTGVDYLLVNQAGIQGGVEGVFLAPMPNPVPAFDDESLDVAVGDVDMDGLPDLYYTNWNLTVPSGIFQNVPVRDRLYLRRFGAGGAAIYVDFSALLPDAPGGSPNFGTDGEIFDIDFDGDLDIVVALGTLPTASNAGLVGVPNLSLGVQVLVNPANLMVPFPQIPIVPAQDLDLRDVEPGDWRENGTIFGPFGRYFDKDMGCAVTGQPFTGQQQLTTLDHL
jgi:hypothetical protein